MRRRTVLLLSVALGTQASSAAAADAELDQIVVTGARLEETLPQDLARYGSGLETIGAETVRRNAYVDVSQALQMQTPGLFLSSRNGPFSYEEIPAEDAARVA